LAKKLSIASLRNCGRNNEPNAGFRCTRMRCFFSLFVLHQLNAVGPSVLYEAKPALTGSVSMQVAPQLTVLPRNWANNAARDDC
jgi:hypothetical protein